jgi:3',5'-cyclic AMP phosphodiesterase CpdA
MSPAIDRRRALKTLFCSSAALALNLRVDRSQAEVAKEAMHFLVLGDFGTGSTGQSAVAGAMQQFVSTQSIKPEGLCLIGDNFYGGVAEGFTTESTRWKKGFEDMYPASVFPGPCWAILGNHDYHDNSGGEKVQLSYAAKNPGTRWTMPAKWYRVDKPLVTFLYLDSNLPGISSGKHKKTGLPKNHLSAEEEQQQLEWFKAELAKPRAPFTIVVAHHPLYSNGGSHGDSKILIKQWGDLLQEHKVHTFLAGHDHDLQHLELESKFTSFVVSGGGGAKPREMKTERKMPYGAPVTGFTHLQVQPDAMTFTHHGIDGGVLHRFSKKLDGSVVLS